jgi:hypothetical protein
MLTFILGAIASTANLEDLNGRLPIGLLNQEGFTTVRIRTSPQGNSQKTIIYKGSNTEGLKCVIQIIWSGLPRDTGKFDTSGIQLPAIHQDEPTYGPTGLKIGSDSRFLVGKYGVSCFVLSKFEYVQMSLTPPITSSNGFATSSSASMMNERVLLERLSRYTLATTSGLRLKQLQSRLIGGFNVNSMVCERSQRVFGDLAEWCGKSGWQLDLNSSGGYITLRKGARYAVLPIGAVDLKLDGSWVPIGDVICLRAGKIYVSKAGIDSLTH